MATLADLSNMWQPTNPGWGGRRPAAPGYQPTNPGWGAASTAAKRRKAAPTKRKPTQTGSLLPNLPELLNDATARDKAMELLAPIFAAQDKRVNDSYAGRADSLRDAYARLAEYGKGVGPAIQDAYGTASRDTAAFGKGFSDAIQQLSQGQADTATAGLAAQGGPQTVTSGMTGGGADAMYAMGGAIPASQLAREGAAFSSAASFLPSTAAGLGVNALRDMERERMEELGGLEADRPASVLDMMGKLLERSQDEVSSAQKARADAAKFALDRQDEQWERGYKNRKLKADTAYKNTKLGLDAVDDADRSKQAWARIDQGNARLSQSQASLNLRAQQYAQSNQQAWARIGISDQNAQLSASRNQLAWERYRKGDKKGAGITSAQAQRFRRDAGKLASKAWNGVKVTREIDGEKVTGKEHLTYQEAMREGLAQGIPLAVMQTALNSYWRKPGMTTGWEKSGEGRPKVPFQLRRPRTAKGRSGIQIPTGFRPTHQTDGLDGYPAIDIMGKPGAPVKAPEDGVVVRHGSAQGGHALYFQGRSGKMYWLGHIDNMAMPGSQVKRGQQIALISADHKAPHVHVAVRA